MTKVKFRVCNKDTREIVGYEIIRDGVWMSSTDGVDWEGGVFSEEQYIREQYTGLRDKNDKEIYEGDVLSVVNPIDRKIRKGVCVYDDEHAKFYLKMHIDGDRWFATDTPSGMVRYEIINHISREPELLTI